MSILQEIDDHARRVEQIMGEYGRPEDTSIYLGRNQAEELKATGSTTDIQFRGLRLVYKGRRVFLVDAENHLAIGF